MPAWLYILRLNSGGLYIGATTDLEQRIHEHQTGKACQTTKADPLEKLVYSEEFNSFSDARKRETQIKRWSRGKKEALIKGDFSLLKQLSESRKN
jgi:putative endonuclease